LNYYDKFKNLSDKNLLQRIERKENFQKEAVKAAYQLLTERGYSIDDPFPESEQVEKDFSPIDKPNYVDINTDFVNSFTEISWWKIGLFSLFFIPFLYLSNHYLNNTPLYRVTYLFSDTIVSFGTISIIMSLIVFSLIFFINNKIRHGFLRINAQKFLLALKVFLISTAIISLFEIAFSDHVTVLKVFTENSYRSFVQSFWRNVFVSFSEELFFKWLLLIQVLKLYGSGKGNRSLAYLSISILFALAHIPRQLSDFDSIHTLHLIKTFLWSYFTCILFIRHRNFALVVALHFLSDLGVIFLENSNSFFNWSILLIGIYAIPGVSNSMIFKPLKKEKSFPIKLIGVCIIIFSLIALLIPKSSLDYYNISKQEYYLNRDSSALTSINKAIEKNENEEDYFIHRGNIYYDLVNYSHAWEDYNSAVEINNFFYAAIKNRGYANRYLDKHQECIDDLTTAIERGYHKSQRVYFNRGNCYLDIGNLQAARADISKVLAADPEDNKALYTMARIYFKEGDFKTSQDYVDKALAIDPDLIEAIELKSMNFTGLKEYEKSLDVMTKAIEMGSDNPMRFYIRGFDYYELEEFSKAKLEFEKSEEYLSDSPDLHYIWAHTLFFLKDYQKGCELLVKARDLGHAEGERDIKEYCN